MTEQYKVLLLKDCFSCPDKFSMDIYYEDQWVTDKKLAPKEEKIIRELKEAITSRDFTRARTTLLEYTETPAK